MKKVKGPDENYKVMKVIEKHEKELKCGVCGQPLERTRSRHLENHKSCDIHKRFETSINCILLIVVAACFSIMLILLFNVLNLEPFERSTAFFTIGIISTFLIGVNALYYPHSKSSTDLDPELIKHVEDKIKGHMALQYKCKCCGSEYEEVI